MKTAGAVILLAIHIFLAWPAVNAFSPTYDEPVHLTAGAVYWKTGDYRYNGYHHPPFGEMWAALPLLVMKPIVPTQHPAWVRHDWTPADQYQFADAFLYHNRVSADRLLAAGRAMQILLSCVLGVVIMLIALFLAGPVAALCAGLFWAFSPTILANATVVSTDLAFALAFFAFFGCLALPRSRGADIGAGISLGLCFASKYFALSIFPITAVLFALDPQMRAEFKRWPVILIIGAVVLGIVYRFSDLDVFANGFMSLFGRSQAGRSSFFNGQHGTQGWFAYFPYVFLVKTPVPVILAVVVALVAVIKREIKIPSALWVPPVIFFAMACVSKVQIGHRHILAVYPFLFVIAAMGISPSPRRKPGPSLSPDVESLDPGFRRDDVLMVFAGATIIWLGVGTWMVRPNFLAYFNEIAGGPTNGYKHLTDSNVDWGQGLKPLAQALSDQDRTNGIYLCYFGVADPHAYGLRYIDIGSDRIVPRTDDAASGINPAKFAISVTNLQATYYADKAAFEWLKNYEPSMRIADSIFVYDFSTHPEALEKVRRMRA